jgi:hypothetical protein
MAGDSKNYKLDGYNLRSFIEDNDGDGLNRDFAPPQKDLHQKFWMQVLLPLKKKPVMMLTF